MRTFLIIQTAFIGDVILATSLLEKLHQHFPAAKIDFLVRKGNEGLFQNHPFLQNCLVWNKSKSKYVNLLKTLFLIRAKKYDVVINCQRFAASGLLTAMSGAKVKTGFKKNPFSFLFTHRWVHAIQAGKHEINRNQHLIEFLTDDLASLPKLYPTPMQTPSSPYVCIAPSSIWFTKQLPLANWTKLLRMIPLHQKIILIGAKNDFDFANQIIKDSGVSHAENHCGRYSLLESAYLMKHAKMNYVNDSAPMHLCSAVDASVTVFYCSTIPEFGFGPLSTNRKIIEIKEALDCRPCGLHGYKSCPKQHFKCGLGISLDEVVFE